MANKVSGSKHTSYESLSSRVKIIERELTDLVLQQVRRGKGRRLRTKALGLLRDIMYITALPERMYDLLVLRYGVQGKVTQDQAWSSIIDYLEKADLYAKDRTAIISEARELIEYEARYHSLRPAKDLYERLTALQQKSS